MSGEIQYVADTILLEKTFQVLGEFNHSGIEKYAFLESVLPSIGKWISSKTGEMYRNEPNSFLRTIEDLVVPGIAFGIHPIFGILVTIAESYGYDLSSIWAKIKSSIMPDLEAGRPVSAEKINSAAQAAIPADPTQPPPEEGEVDDLLYPLRAMMNRGDFTKEAIEHNLRGGMVKEALGRSSMLQGIRQNEWFNPVMGLMNTFSGRRRGNIIVGLITWLLKTMLLSAGLLTVTGMVLPKKNPVTGQEPREPSPSEQSSSMLSAPASVPPSTGAGAHVYKQSPGDMWMEQLQGRQPPEMVLNWAVQSYPVLNQYRSIILNTPSFWNAVRNITPDWKPGDNEVIIPDPYKSRDDVLKLFIGDVFKSVNTGSN